VNRPHGLVPDDLTTGRSSTNAENLVDTNWFTTLDTAPELLAPGARYDELARRHFVPVSKGEPPIGRLVLQSLLVRIHGLHHGIWRGLADDNPWEVWPLMRSMFELEVAMLFVLRMPEYFHALSAEPSAARRNHPALPKMTKMLYHVCDVIPAGVAAYAELSSVTHVGVKATWMAHQVRPVEHGLILTWSSRPTFRPEQVPIAAAQLREIVEECVVAFEALVTHLSTDVAAVEE
jgi:hypothetical protein